MAGSGDPFGAQWATTLKRVTAKLLGRARIL
jgi:hypothetical protein